MSIYPLEIKEIYLILFTEVCRLYVWFWDCNTVTHYHSTTRSQVVQSYRKAGAVFIDYGESAVNKPKYFAHYNV